MAVIKTIDNTAGSAGTHVEQNNDIDTAIAAGDPSVAGVTLKNGLYYFNDPELGEVPLKSAGGTANVVDLEGATSGELAAIENLGTVNYMAGKICWGYYKCCKFRARKYNCSRTSSY